MKQVNFIWLCVTCLVFLQPVYAQDDTQSYETFRVLLKTGRMMDIENGVLTDTTLINFVSNSEQKEIPISEIRALNRRVGNKAFLYAGIGLGVGLVTSLVMVVSKENNPDSKIKGDAGTLIPGITIFSAAVGFIWGLFVDDWEKVPLNASINAYLNRADYQLTIRFSF